jgi:hypothetical protein
VFLFVGCKTDRSTTNNSVTAGTAVAGGIAGVLIGAKVGIVAGGSIGVFSGVVPGVIIRGLAGEVLQAD